MAYMYDAKKLETIRSIIDALGKIDFGEDVNSVYLVVDLFDAHGIKLGTFSDELGEWTYEDVSGQSQP